MLPRLIRQANQVLCSGAAAAVDEQMFVARAAFGGVSDALWGKQRGRVAFLADLESWKQTNFFSSVKW